MSGDIRGYILIFLALLGLLFLLRLYGYMTGAWWEL